MGRSKQGRPAPGVRPTPGVGGSDGPRARDERRSQTPSGALARRATLIALLAIVALVIVVRARVADVPFERDEGEYAYAGQLILDGVAPYRMAYNMKFPGTYYAYALTMEVFGETVRGVRYGLILANLASLLLVFVIGRRLGGNLVAVAAAVSFALLSLDRYVLGLFAHATHFVLPPVLAGLYLLMRPNRRVVATLASGILIGLAVVVKQHAIAFLPLAALLVVMGKGDPRSSLLHLGLLILGAAIPFATLCAYLENQGVLTSFWFWTIQYAREYVSERGIGSFLPQLTGALRGVSRANLVLWMIAGVGLIALWRGRWQGATRILVTGLLGAAFIAVCPGFYFREHYFILVLPALALLVGIAFESGARWAERGMSATAARTLATTVFAGLAVALVVRQSDVLFAMSPRDISRTCYGVNPFIESVPVAEYIKAHTTEQDRIAVLGSEPQICFYANRRSATGFMYTYALMEKQKYASKMQGDMIREIEAAHPKYLVIAQCPYSWSARPESDRRILDWGSRYVASCYDLVGVADILSFEETRYVWDAAAAGYTPSSDNAVLVYRRKGDAACVARG